MEEQVQKLETFYRRCENVRVGEDGDDFDNDGDCWEFQHPEKIQYWSLNMIPFRDIICFAAKFKDSELYFTISFDEKIKDIAQDVGPIIKIHCVTEQTGLFEKEQYHFTIVMDSSKIEFNISNFIRTLEPTEYRIEIPELENKVDTNYFKSSSGRTAIGKALSTRLRTLFVDFAVLKSKLDIKKSSMTSRSISTEIPSVLEGQGSMDTPGTQQSRGSRKSKQSMTPPPSRKKSNLASSSGLISTEKEASASDVGEHNFVSMGNFVKMAIFRYNGAKWGQKREMHEKMAMEVRKYVNAW